MNRWVPLLVFLILAALGAACSNGGGEPNPLTHLAPGETFTLSPENLAGQDEDPAILVARDGSLHAAWYSNRNGAQPQGGEDKEIFLVRSGDGKNWSSPIQLTRHAGWAFYPSLAQDGGGGFHLAWWRRNLLPPGCDPGLTCVGTDDRIVHKSSMDGVGWDLDAGTEIAGGPGDRLPVILYDRVGDRLLIYFAAQARGPDGSVDLNETTLRIYLVARENGTWSGPVRLVGVNPDTSHNTYPHVVQRPDGTFAMTWTRYDASASPDVLQVIQEPSTETLFATSADGLNWDAPVVLSDIGTGPAIDVFPWLHADHAGESWFVTWITAAGGGGKTVELRVGDAPTARIDRPELAGYTGRILPTATPGVYWGAWVRGENPTQKIDSRFFVK